MKPKIAREKFDAILKTSHDLFWKFGIKRVSIEEICREADVSKMTFYRAFPNKTMLAIEVVENLFDKMLVDYRKLMDEDISFEEKIRKQLMMKFEGSKEISSELVKDIYGDQDSEIFKYWKTRADEMLHIVWKDYENAQKMGWLRKDIKLEFIMYMSNKVAEIANDEQLQSMYPNMQSLIMEIANFFFYGMFSRNKE